LIVSSMEALVTPSALQTRTKLRAEHVNMVFQRDGQKMAPEFYD